MPSLNELNTKISSLKNTQKITRTMKLVAASKLRRAQQAQENAKDYAAALRLVISRLAGGDAAHPLVTPRQRVARILLIVFTSDRGLCGGFNNNLQKSVGQWVEENEARCDEIRLSFCGRRGYTFFRHRVPVQDYYEGATVAPDYETGRKIADEATAMFLDGSYDEVFIMANRFQSALTQVPTLERLLPTERTPEDEGGVARDYIFEPGKADLLDTLLPKAVTFKVFNALLENAAGEHAARMTAMDSATNNADDLVKAYTLQRNRARQAAITTELTEIISGAESL